MGRKKNEIPQLKAIGLYAANTAGSGNCLFHALSDQLYGDQSQHLDYRKITVEYMTGKPDKFKAFVSVQVGGGARRNPKRKTAGSLSSPFNPGMPTEDEIEAAFQRSLKIMKEGGAYGDNAEIVAFALAFKVDIKIYEEQHGVFYIVPGGETPGEVLPMLYIVHHSWEHYSSIRNIDGPHTGLPKIREVQPTAEAEQQLKKELAEGPIIEPWMIEIALKSLPFPVNSPNNRAAVEKMLKQCNGNINYAVSLLLPDSSPESSGRSSSIERDPDSDDEKAQKPTKKQDRRINRPHPLRNDLALRAKDSDQISPDPRRLAAALKKLSDRKPYDPDETEEENWQNGEATSKDSTTTSDSSSASDYAPAPQPKSGGVSLKLSAPKKQVTKNTKAPSLSSSNSEQSNLGEYDADAEKVKLQRPINKPKRRLVSGNERDKYLAEKAARNTTTKKLDMGIQAIHI